MSPKKNNHCHCFGIGFQTFSHTIIKTCKEYFIKIKSDIYHILLFIYLFLIIFLLIVYNSFIFAVCLVFSSTVIFHLIFFIITENIFVV